METKTCECCGNDEATTKMMFDYREIDACEHCAEREAEYMEEAEYNSLSEDW